jgi:hypothetical protein
MELHRADSMQKKKFGLFPTGRKLMITVFWDCEGVSLLGVMPRTTTTTFN